MHECMKKTVEMYLKEQQTEKKRSKSERLSCCGFIVVLFLLFISFHTQLYPHSPPHLHTSYFSSLFYKFSLRFLSPPLKYPQAPFSSFPPSFLLPPPISTFLYFTPTDASSPISATPLPYFPVPKTTTTPPPTHSPPRWENKTLPPLV